MILSLTQRWTTKWKRRPRGWGSQQRDKSHTLMLITSKWLACNTLNSKHSFNNKLMLRTCNKWLLSFISSSQTTTTTTTKTLSLCIMLLPTPLVNLIPIRRKCMKTILAAYRGLTLAMAQSLVGLVKAAAAPCERGCLFSINLFFFFSIDTSFR